MEKGCRIKQKINSFKNIEQSPSGISIIPEEDVVALPKIHTLLDLPIPNEIIDNIFTYLSSLDLLNLSIVGNERLRECSCKLLRKTPRVLPELLHRMSAKGELEQIKQIFNCVIQENITVEEMGVKNNPIYDGEKPKFVDDNSGGYNGRSPLIEAALGGYDKVCRYLLKEQNANIEARDDYQMTALIVTALSNNTREVIKLLIENEANIKAQSTTLCGKHAAWHALEMLNFDIVKMLVEKDKSVINLKAWGEQTLLIFAATYGDVDLVKFLLDHDAIVNLKDYEGRTALHHAVGLYDGNKFVHVHYGWDANYLEYMQIIKMLVDKDRSVIDLKDDEGRTAVQLTSDPEIIMMLKWCKIGDVGLHDSKVNSLTFY